MPGRERDSVVCEKNSLKGDTGHAWPAAFALLSERRGPTRRLHCHPGLAEKMGPPQQGGPPAAREHRPVRQRVAALAWSALNSSPPRLGGASGTHTLPDTPTRHGEKTREDLVFRISLMSC